MTTERLKVWLGFSIVAGLFALAFTIAIAHVDERSSYGLQDVISVIGTLGGTFAGWAFGSHSEERKDG